MNGLKYIRTQCNLSLNELATVLGISRQALSFWETNQKPMPERRREQLAEFFGVDIRFLGDITDEDVQYLREKVMFSYLIEDKEIRLYRPKEGTKTIDRQYMTFADDSEMTLDEKYACAKKRKQAALDHADEIIRYHDRCKHILDKTNVINHRCCTYEGLNKLLAAGIQKPIIQRVPYFDEIQAVINAMLLAHGFLSEDEVKASYRNRGERYDETDFVKSLAKEIAAHWEEKEKEFVGGLARGLSEEEREKRRKNLPVDTRPLEEQIREYEEYCKEMRSKHGDTPPNKA